MEASIHSTVMPFIDGQLRRAYALSGSIPFIFYSHNCYVYIDVLNKLSPPLSLCTATYTLLLNLAQFGALLLSTFAFTNWEQNVHGV